MAEISAIISSSGGIAAGVPFTLLDVLAVQQVSPPVAFTQRLAFVLDAEKSIVAPGVLSGVGSFVMGRAVIDNAGASQILIGDTINVVGAAGQSDHQTLIGAALTIPGGVGANNSHITALGQGILFNVAVNHNSFGGSVVIGDTATLNCLASADATNSVVIGQGAIGTGGQCVVIGPVAQTTDNQGIAIGVLAVGQLQSVCIGGANSGVKGVTIGGAGASGGTNTVAIGWRTKLAGATDSIGIGVDITLAVNNWCQLGSVAHPINTIAWSNGRLDIVAGALVYTGGLGTVTPLAPA